MTERHVLFVFFAAALSAQRPEAVPAPDVIYYEAANADASIAGKGWGIEHAFIGRRDHLPRMKNLGLLLSLQDHLYLAGPSLVKYSGRQRAFLTTPVKMYLDAGLPVARATRSPVDRWAGSEDLARGCAADGHAQPLVPDVRGTHER